jgi:CBS domain-containing protein
MRSSEGLEEVVGFRESPAEGPASRRRGEMKVREAMAKTISTARPDDTVARAAELMKMEDCGFIPVVAEDKVVGVVTDRDIVIRCLADGHADVLTETIDHVMTPSAWTIDADAPIEAAAHEMAVHELRRLPVMEKDRLVGVLSFGNLEQALHAQGPAATEATLGITHGA